MCTNYLSHSTEANLVGCPNAYLSQWPLTTGGDKLPSSDSQGQKHGRLVTAFSFFFLNPAFYHSLPFKKLLVGPL